MCGNVRTMWTESASIQVTLPLSKIQQQHRSWFPPQRRSPWRASISVAGNIHTSELAKKKTPCHNPFNSSPLPFSVKQGVLAFKFSSRRNINFLVEFLQFRFFNRALQEKKPESLNLHAKSGNVLLPLLISQKTWIYVWLCKFISNSNHPSAET